MEALLKDLQYGARLLLRNRGFAAVAIVSLALGIGANTAIFSVVQHILASPFPVAEPDRLVAVFTTDARNPGNLPMSHLNFKDIRQQNAMLSDTASVALSQVNYLGTGGAAEQLLCQVVTGNYFDVLGVRPALGRPFRPDEDAAPGSGPVAVISHGFWQRRLGSDPNVLGRTLTINRRPFTVVGIAPPGFTGTNLFAAPDLWVPASMHDVVQPGFDWYETRRGLFLFVFGRLKPGVTLAQARSNLAAIAARLERDFPNDNQGRGVAAIPLAETRLAPDGDAGALVQVSLILMVVVGVVLLVACANIANLLLARATARSREIAVRLAIGARRGRLVRQLMTESLLLAILGGAIGLLVGYWTLDLIRSAPLQLPPNFVAQIAIDGRVLAFTTALSLLTGVLFGLAPSLRASRPDLVPVLKNETVPARGSRALPRWVGARQALVAGQVALSLIALVAAGLFLRSLMATQRIDPGFETERVLAAGFELGREGYTEERGLQFHDAILERVSALPGVVSAAIAQNRPFQGGFARSVLLEGAESSEQNRRLVQVNAVTPGYFTTAGVPLMRGRDFTSADGQNAPLVVIINQTMADTFFPGGDAIGRRFRFFGDTAETTVIGIARDAKYNGLTEEPQPFAYQPMRQAYDGTASLLVRTAAGGTALADEVTGIARQIDPRLTLLDVATLRGQVDQVLAPQRVLVTLLAVFGALALALAAIGLYGVASYSVTQRTREIGIRMALGASRGNVMRLVLAQGLGLVLAGAAVGALAALLLARSVAGLLIGIAPADPVTYAVTGTVLVGVAAIASYVPARRATRIDPLRALRYE